MSADSLSSALLVRLSGKEEDYFQSIEISGRIEVVYGVVEFEGSLIGSWGARRGRGARSLREMA